MQPKVFTPLNEDKTIRGRFDIKDVEVLDGELGLRKRGYKATVKIHGKIYQVIGTACGLPNCMCDAYLKEVHEQVAI